MPRAIVSLSRVSWPARTGAAARRRLDRGGRVELYFAFDDPCSAVAALDLEARLASRAVTLALRPVVRRGISEDPAAERKRRYAVEDARRLAERAGLELARSAPLAPEACSFLAAWAAAAPAGVPRRRFVTRALRALWFDPHPPELSPAGYAPLWREALEGEPPARPDEALVRANERRMRLQLMYETPAAWVHGRWYFAHDRPRQICERLDELGWGER
jgi:hypothetical protein